MEGTALVPFGDSTYVARRNIFNFFGIKCRILSATGQPQFFIQLKAFKLKEDITVWGDEAMSQAVLSIKARQILDFGAAYDVVDSATSEKIGVLKRKGLKSILKDEWVIMDAADQELGHIKEDSALMALLRRFLSVLIPQNYTVDVNGTEVGTVRGTWNPFVVKYDVDLSQNTQLDPRLAMAGVVLLMTVEGKQG